jgi:CRISPR-associated protein Cmr5
MSNKGIEDGRAKFAYNCVQEAIAQKEIKQDDYKSHVKRIPMMIKTNGMGNTLAFIMSKGKAKGNDFAKQKDIDTYKFNKNKKDFHKNPKNKGKQFNEELKIKYNDYDLFGEQLTKWFQEERCYLLPDKCEISNLKSFIDMLVKQKSQGYRAITMETLSLVSWLKRFADGLIEG